MSDSLNCCPAPHFWIRLILRPAMATTFGPNFLQPGQVKIRDGVVVRSSKQRHIADSPPEVVSIFEPSRLKT